MQCIWVIFNIYYALFVFPIRPFYFPLYATLSHPIYTRIVPLEPSTAHSRIKAVRSTMEPNWWDAAVWMWTWVTMVATPRDT